MWISGSTSKESQKHAIRRRPRAKSVGSLKYVKLVVELIPRQDWILIEQGWTMCCLNCKWKIMWAEILDINQRCGPMEEVKPKGESIKRLMTILGIKIRTRVESICIQLRTVLEVIVFGSLVSNKDD